MTRILAVTVTAMIASWDAAGVLTPSAVLLGAALTVAALVVLAARRPAAGIVAGPLAAASPRERARTLLIRLCDPDAAGRPRPRAPAALVRAAHV